MTNDVSYIVKYLTTTLKLFAILMVLVGIVYPVAITALAGILSSYETLMSHGLIHEG